MKAKLSSHTITRLLLVNMLSLPMLGNRMSAQNPESYAVFNEDTGTLTFKHDTKKPAGAYSLNVDQKTPDWFAAGETHGVNNNRIKKVVFDASFAEARPTSCSWWFYGCNELTTIEGIENLNTEKVTNMYAMFKGCESLAKIDLSSLDTQNVTDMAWMFNACRSLTELDLSNFNTKNVKDMYAMFAICNNLATLKLSNFDTQNVTNMGGMFSECKSLTELDLSSFNTKKVTDMFYMFQGCSNLATIYVSDKFVTTRLVSGSDIFKGCEKLVGAVAYDSSKTGRAMANYDTGYFTDITTVGKPVSYAVLDKETGTLTFRHDKERPAGAYLMNKGTNKPGWFVEGNPKEINKNNIKKVVFDTSFAEARPTSCYWWFSGCNELTTIEGIENLNTENATNVYAMFYGCTSLKEIDLSNHDMRNVTDMNFMFYGCKNLTKVNLANLKTQNVKSMLGMFYECSSLTELDLSNFDTKNLTDMSFMFFECNDLAKLNISSFDTQNVTNMKAMFNGCNSLTELNVANFNTQNVADMSFMFYGCGNLTKVDVSNFDTQNATSIKAMFYECTNIAELNLSKFNTQKMTDMSFAFYKCNGLTALDVSNFDTKEVTSMKCMFYECNNISKLDISNFDTQNVADMGGMFYGCSKLTTIYVSDKFVTTACQSGIEMFKGCEKLVGAVAYDDSKSGKEMANYDTGYFTKAATGIDATPISDNAAATYYDVQGRRLDAPQKGINIVKRSGRTMKVLVK